MSNAQLNGLKYDTIFIDEATDYTLNIDHKTKCRNCSCWHFNIQDVILNEKVKFQKTCKWCALYTNHKGCSNYEPTGNLEYLEWKLSEKERLSL